MFIDTSEIGHGSGQAFARAMVIFVMFGVILDSFELLAARRLYAAGGIFDRGTKPTYQRREGEAPDIFSSYTRFFSVLGVLDSFVTYRIFVGIICLQIAMAVFAVVAPVAAPYALALTICMRLVPMVRHGAYGSEGADHVLLIVLAALLTYYLAPSPLARRGVMWFIAAETMLAYITAGVVKARNHRWRQGTALTHILSTNLFKCPLFLEVFAERQKLNRALCRSVIVFECAAPLLVLLGPAGCLVFIVMGVVFHLSIAAAQGLNLFVFAFFATYPALLFTSADFARAVWGA